MSITAITRATAAHFAPGTERPVRGVSTTSPPQRAPLALGRRPSAPLEQTVLEPAALAPTIETGRLLLRQHTIDDAEAWFRIQSDPEVIRYLPWPQRTAEESFAHLERRTRHNSLAWRNDFLALAVVLDGHLIGDVSMHLRTVTAPQREVEVGWLLDSAHSGRGYAREAASALLDFAFAQLGARTASAVIDERNLRSLALARRLGFITQGRTGRTWRLLINHRMLQSAASGVPNSLA